MYFIVDRRTVLASLSFLNLDQMTLLNVYHAQVRSDQITLHLFQPHQADQMFDPDLGFIFLVLFPHMGMLASPFQPIASMCPSCRFPSSPV